jgi:hypothetical protein
MTEYITRTQAEQLEEAKRKAALVSQPSVQQENATHEGATEDQTGDRTGPGAGYDTEPEQVKDKGGVA